MTSNAYAAIDDATFDEMLEALRRFVWTTLVPLEREVEEAGWIPPNVIDQMRELGIFGLSIAPEYGGLGLTSTQEARA